jgi:hypothetical protein
MNPLVICPNLEFLALLKATVFTPLRQFHAPNVKARFYDPSISLELALRDVPAAIFCVDGNKIEDVHADLLERLERSNVLRVFIVRTESRQVLDRLIESDARHEGLVELVAAIFPRGNNIRLPVTEFSVANVVITKLPLEFGGLTIVGALRAFFLDLSGRL